MSLEQKEPLGIIHDADDARMYEEADEMIAVEFNTISVGPSMEVRGNEGLFASL